MREYRFDSIPFSGKVSSGSLSGSNAPRGDGAIRLGSCLQFFNLTECVVETDIGRIRGRLVIDEIAGRLIMFTDDGRRIIVNYWTAIWR